MYLALLIIIKVIDYDSKDLQVRRILSDTITDISG
jgi:hypothetical protein